MMAVYGLGRLYSFTAAAPSARLPAHRETTWSVKKALGVLALATVFIDQFELIALAAAALIAGLVALDGGSNWMEGAQLLLVSVILGLAFFFLPA